MRTVFLGMALAILSMTAEAVQMPMPCVTTQATDSLRGEKLLRELAKMNPGHHLDDVERWHMDLRGYDSEPRLVIRPGEVLCGVERRGNTLIPAPTVAMFIIHDELNELWWARAIVAALAVGLMTFIIWRRRRQLA